MMYQIEFIRYVDGRAHPEVLERINGVFPTLQAAIIDQGTALFRTMQVSQHAQGFRVLEKGERVVAHRFKGDM